MDFTKCFCPRLMSHSFCVVLLSRAELTSADGLARHIHEIELLLGLCTHISLWLKLLKNQAGELGILPLT